MTSSKSAIETPTELQDQTSTMQTKTSEAGASVSQMQVAEKTKEAPDNHDGLAGFQLLRQVR